MKEEVCYILFNLINKLLGFGETESIEYPETTITATLETDIAATPEGNISATAEPAFVADQVALPPWRPVSIPLDSVNIRNQHDVLTFRALTWPVLIITMAYHVS